MNDQQAYWEAKILGWEASTYTQSGRSSQSLLDRIAAPFRVILRRRMDVAVELIKDRLKEKTVVDCGCGTGAFLARLLPYGPKRLIGVDIARPAIEIAERVAEAQGLRDRMEFVCADVRVDHRPLNEADIITAIGFMDYLAPDEMKQFSRSLAGRTFLISFPEKVWSLRAIIHRIYLMAAHCPGSYLYSRFEMDRILEEAGASGWWYYVDADKIRYVTNLSRS